MGQLDGRIAVITGAGDGIGAAIAQRFVDEGAKGVLIAELNEQTGQAMANQLGDAGLFVRTDAGNRDDVEAMIDASVDHWGRLDILVNNAWGGGVISRGRAQVCRGYG